MKPQNAHAQEDRLLDFAYGELPASEARLVEAHLEGCARCTQALDDIRGVRATMSQLSVEAAPDAGLDSLMAYAQQAARRAAAGPAPKPSRWRRWLLPVVGLASVSTLGVLTFHARSPELTRPDLRAAAVQEPGSAKETQPAPTAAVPAAAPALPPAAAPAAQVMSAEAEWEGKGARERAAPSKRAVTAELKGREPLRADDWANAGSGGGFDTRVRRGTASKAKAAPPLSVRVGSEEKVDKADAAKPAQVTADEASVDEESVGMAERRATEAPAPQEGPPRDALRLGTPRPVARADAPGEAPMASAPAAMKAEAASIPKARAFGAPVAEASSGAADFEAPPPPPSAPVMKKQAPSADRIPAVSVAELSRQARMAHQAGDRAREAGLIRAALAAGASGAERWELLNQLCESEFALGMYSRAVEACNLVIHEAPASSAASAARRRLASETAPAQPGKPSK